MKSVEPPREGIPHSVSPQFSSAPAFPQQAPPHWLTVTAISLSCNLCLGQEHSHVLSQTLHTHIYTPQPDLSPTFLRGGCVKRHVCSDAPGCYASALASHTSEGHPTSTRESLSRDLCEGILGNLPQGGVTELHNPYTHHSITSGRDLKQKWLQKPERQAELRIQGSRECWVLDSSNNSPH